ncbi:MAG: outer membrane beta-barrel protein, partial [Bacteroidota bacterium]
RIVLAIFDTVGLRFNYQNLDVFETNGVNLRAELRWEDWLEINSGFAYTRLYNFWSEASDAPRFTALPELQNELKISIPRTKVQAVFTHRYFGQQIRFFSNSAGEVEEGFIGSYQLLNGTLSSSFWKDRIFVAFGAKNILNTQTVPTSETGGGGAHSSVGNSVLLNWGRTYFVRLDVKLAKTNWRPIW